MDRRLARGFEGLVEARDQSSGYTSCERTRTSKDLVCSRVAFVAASVTRGLGVVLEPSSRASDFDVLSLLRRQRSHALCEPGLPAT